MFKKVTYARPPPPIRIQRCAYIYIALYIYNFGFLKFFSYVYIAKSANTGYKTAFLKLFSKLYIGYIYKHTPVTALLLSHWQAGKLQ